MPWWCDKHQQHSIDEVCPGCSRAAQLQEWKYLTRKLDLPISENELARLGRQGWELAGCVTREEPGGSNSPGRLYKITRHIYYFKMARKLTPS
jgi:hypothetical protein